MSANRRDEATSSVSSGHFDCASGCPLLGKADIAIVEFNVKRTFRRVVFLLRNEFRLREANEQLRNCISGHGFAE
jgi:hypothetical protein